MAHVQRALEFLQALSQGTDPEDIVTPTSSFNAWLLTVAVGADRAQRAARILSGHWAPSRQPEYTRGL